MWAGGISKQHHQQNEDYIGHGEFVGSDHATAGLTCYSCHAPHGSEFEHDLRTSARDNGLCIQCHTGMSDVGAMEAHTRHSASASGAPRCVDCHMSAAQKSAVNYDIHQHNFKVLRPDQTLEFAQPNACAMCHRSVGDTVDTNIKTWDDPEDIAVNTWLDQQFKAMFGSSDVTHWSMYE